MNRFEQAYQDGTVLDLTAAFCALTGDIVMHYTYGEDLSSLTDKDFKNDIRGGILESERSTHLNRFLPFLIPLLKFMPSGLLAYFKPATAAILGEVTKRSQNALQKSNNSHQNPDGKNQTMVEALSSPTISAEERTLPRLQDEGMILLSGGTESTANALSVAAFHLSDDKSIIKRHRAELQPVMSMRGSEGGHVPLAKPEQLPYLVRHLLPIYRNENFGRGFSDL